MGEHWHGKKWLKIKVYIVNHKGKECTWQAVSDDHYFKFFILRSDVITIQKVCGTVSSFVQVQRNVMITISELQIRNGLISFVLTDFYFN